eukprot:scaffold665195_cov57-Prasinocladus_malaysianus.AAC.1
MPRSQLWAAIALPKATHLEECLEVLRRLVFGVLRLVQKEKAHHVDVLVPIGWLWDEMWAPAICHGNL